MRAKGDPEPARVRAAIIARRRPLVVPADFTRAEFDGLGFLRHGSGARTLYYVHGGAYVSDAHPRHFALVRRLARALDAAVVMPLYPLAPEANWRDSHAAMVGLADSMSPDFFVGDSAGGGYVLSVLMALRDSGRLGRCRVGLISPWLDLTSSAPGIEDDAAADPWLRLDWAHLYAEWWSAGEPSRWQVSPAFGELHHLPPTLALAGTRDVLYPENRAFAERARAAGWDYTLITEPGLLHVYPLLPIPEARRGFNQLTDFLNR